ncbi:hypothetical protein F5X98DRAFT_385623 [Xylaria grammica]|nr:hypothetical protein F5X98DRAFT_385623 [Xylaria grammica]
MAFPQFIPVSNLSEVDTHFNASTVSISTVVPAVRERMDCRSYEPARIHTNITLNQTRVGVTNPLDVLIDGEDCNLYIDGNNIEIETSPLTTYVGQVLTLSGEGQCSDLVYIWGKIDYGANPVIQHIDAMGCNVTFGTVDVNTTFIGTDLNLDFQNPPQPLIDSTAQRTINISDSCNLNYLGDPSASARVAAAIKFQHGIIQAQSLSQFLAPANGTNVTIAEPTSPGDNDAQPRYNATVTNPAGRRRVVQDAASTHILVALLAVTLVLFIIGWAGNPGTDVLPRSPTTIASIAALIAGGNLLAYLPPHAQSLDDIAAALGGPKARFWLGWGNLPDEEGRISGGENEAGVSQFGIFVVDEEETKSKE